MEIVDGIHKVEGVTANTYVITDGEDLTIVDTGMPRSARKILNYVHRINHQTSNISNILLTHCHIDHVGSAYELRRITNAKLGIHLEDADYLSGKKPVPGPKGALGILFKAMSPFFRFKTVEPDMTLRENDKVGRFTVIHTPGHTPGSICLYDPEKKVLFAGDTIKFDGKRLSGPPERFTPDMQLAILSIGKISKLDFNLMLSGHGEPLKSDASERVKELYASLS